VEYLNELVDDDRIPQHENNHPVLFNHRDSGTRVEQAVKVYLKKQPVLGGLDFEFRCVRHVLIPSVSFCGRHKMGLLAAIIQACYLTRAVPDLKIIHEAAISQIWRWRRNLK
jgi:hypothetical protein